jgi:formylmethanofuran dehydrogenase subunit D
MKTYRQILKESVLIDQAIKKYPKLKKQINQELKDAKQLSKEENDEYVVFIDNGKEVGTAKGAKGKGIEIIAAFDKGKQIR